MNLNNILSILILIILTILLITTCNKQNNTLDVSEIKNNILIDQLQKVELNLLDSIKLYSEKDGVINNNYKTYIQQYEKEIKIFDTTKFTNPELDSLFTNWKPE